MTPLLVLLIVIGIAVGVFTALVERRRAPRVQDPRIAPVHLSGH